VLVVEEAREATPELVSALTELIPQLSSSPPPDQRQLADILAGEGVTLFVARVDGRIVGTLTLAVFRAPTGLRAWIEDVVVDESARGHGAGEQLTSAAIDKAAAIGARTVDLTSRPQREAANRLYRRVGFAERQTNVYRYTIDA
jgi:ribosomal protein S18 acetylase RimI-like enzyme